MKILYFNKILKIYRCDNCACKVEYDSDEFPENEQKHFSALFGRVDNILFYDCPSCGKNKLRYLETITDYIKG